MIHWRGVMLAMASAQDVTSTLTSTSLVSPFQPLGLGGVASLYNSLFLHGTGVEE